MGDSSHAMGARQAESRTRPLVGKSKPHRSDTVEIAVCSLKALNGLRRLRDGRGKIEHYAEPAVALAGLGVDQGLRLEESGRRTGLPEPASDDPDNA
ncbi:hypothetical protein FB595_1597 [Sphingobium sp. AEW010]|nr:hypothetical protein FB595_1597 [Sphingobium sp. AEW010]TWD15124.1 hypothetical protein FB596_1607 [Sphingobium sp. AEW013]TWD19073.1 hypothetical protein FB594_1601 [Sphingobium sp. AEW001]